MLLFGKKFAQFWSPVKTATLRKDIFDPTVANIDRAVIMNEKDVIDETGDLDEELSLI